MSEIKIIENDGKIEIYTPYNPEFVKEMHKIGSAKWDGSKKAWTADTDAEDIVRNVLKDIYGYEEGKVEDTVTVTVKALVDSYAERDAIRLFGKMIARAFGRDSGAKIGEDVTIVNGKFTSSGSARYWETCVEKGTEFIVKNVSKAMLERENNAAFEILSVSDTQSEDEKLKKLQAQKEELEKKLAEINAKIAELTK